MTVAFWCVLIALCLPYVCTAFGKFSDGKFGPSQNHDPRTFLDGLQGFAKRAHSAQLNSFEVTPAFAAAVRLRTRPHTSISQPAVNPALATSRTESLPGPTTSSDGRSCPAVPV